MTPRTRNSNKDANFKVYYSKKVPQQIYFPHRRKTVRRPWELAKDESDTRQVRLSLEKMKGIQRMNTVQDSDEEDEEEDLEEEGGVAIDQEAKHEEDEEQRRKSKRVEIRGKRTRSVTTEADNETEDEHTRPTSKRRRKVTPNSCRRSIHIKVESKDGNILSASARRNADRSHTLGRQSTMTQLVEGRLPLSDTEEPSFKPVKHSPRLSWIGQGKKTKDKRQRTLTQMVPGMRPSEPLSDTEAEEGAANADVEQRESQAYGAAIAARLAQEGLIKEEGSDVEEPSNEDQASHKGVHRRISTNNHEDIVKQHLEAPSHVVDSVEDDEDDEDGESYRPTQFIDAPAKRIRRSSRQTSDKKQGGLRMAEVPATITRSTRRSRFSLLSTPEKRRIREIPSSQSPTDSPLTTQVSPSQKHRPPLKERSGNNTRVAETPSRPKQVIFREFTKELVPPPTLREFKSTIQDSEDEDVDLVEANENDGGGCIGAPTQAMIYGMDNAAPGRHVGTETQAILDRIDQACARPHDGGEGESSQELEDSALPGVQPDLSPELGEQFPNHTSDSEEGSQDVCPPYQTAHAGVKAEQWESVEMLDLTTQAQSLQADVSSVEGLKLANASIELPVVTEQVPSSPPIIRQPVEDTCPSTPMVIMDSEDSEDETGPTPPRKSTSRALQPSSTAFQQSSDLDEQMLQLPCSPAAQQDTQQSHSSKAEQQLHNEWLSYSQYVNERLPQSSSMIIAQDKFSYHATPMPARHLPPLQPSDHYMSQATTVDEVTPRKNRTHCTYSTNTTPHKIAGSQPLVSPSKPPPLFIPSSFPSPTKVQMEEWSSPVFGDTQTIYGAGGSMEDFSIPLPPPIEDDWKDGRVESDHGH